MKILITGGHVTPALALIEEMDTQNVVFVGRQFVPGSKTIPSFEYKEVTSRGIPFINLKTGKLTRTFSLKALGDWLQIPLGFIRAYQILSAEKPHVIMSFGSYLAVPIAFWGWMFGVPVYTHEQTVMPGLANRIIGKFATKIFLAFDQTEKYFPLGRTMLTGNPIRKAIFVKIKAPFPFAKSKPVIYITGGSLGSHSINVHIKNILAELLKKYTVIHQIGESEEFHDFAELSHIRDTSYYPMKHVAEDEIGYVYSWADVVVARAGANTFFELVALEKPAVLIPLPWSAGGEQHMHAQIFKAAKAGEVFEQTGTSEALLATINQVYEKREEYHNNIISLHKKYALDATATILHEILSTR